MFRLPRYTYRSASIHPSLLSPTSRISIQQWTRHTPPTNRPLNPCESESPIHLITIVRHDETQRRSFHFNSFSDPNFQQQQQREQEQQQQEQVLDERESILNHHPPENNYFESHSYHRRRTTKQQRKNKRSASSSPHMITLDSLEQPVREDSNQFISLLDNTVKLVDRATECAITESYQQSVDIATTAIEQVEYLEKSLHLAPREMNFKFLLDTVDDCRCRAFSARATANAALGAPREIVDADIKASRNEIEFVHDTRI